VIVLQAGIPLKTKEQPHGVFTESQLFDMLAEIYQSVLHAFFLSLMIADALFV
jgi:hypothetical protein